MLGLPQMGETPLIFHTHWIACQLWCTHCPHTSILIWVTIRRTGSPALPAGSLQAFPRLLCRVCCKNIRRFQYYVCCNICNSQYHIQCISFSREDYKHVNESPWYRVKCMASNLPFNHYDDDIEFLNSLSDLRYSTTKLDLNSIRDMIFIPFDLNDQTTRALPLSGTDPDTNYLNQIEDCNRMSCNYLLEDDFTKRYKSDKLENSFSLFHVNIQSLNSKSLPLTAYLSTLQTDFKIIGLSETWLNEQNKADAKIRYYNAIHSCRDTLSRGGGVSLYIHESMDFKERSDLSVVNENIESCFVEIPKGTAVMNYDVIAGVIYRPPGKSVDMFNEQLNSMLQRMSGENKTLYIMGDFNINLPNFENHHPTNNFLETLYSYSLTPLITKPTRITENTATLIDNVFTNNSVSDRRHLSGILYMISVTIYPFSVLILVVNIRERKNFMENEWLTQILWKWNWCSTWIYRFHKHIQKGVWQMYTN